MLNLNELLKLENGSIDSNGIFTADLSSDSQKAISKKAWERIYNFNLENIKKDRSYFNQNKLMIMSSKLIVHIILVGSEAGAPLNYFSTFPAPATSNPAFGFPKLVFLVNFT